MPQKIGVHVVDPFHFPGYGNPPAISINPDLFHFLTSAIFPGAADDPGDRTYREPVTSSKNRSKRNVAALCYEPEPADPQHPDEKRTGKYKGAHTKRKIDPVPIGRLTPVADPSDGAGICIKFPRQASPSNLAIFPFSSSICM